jgi:murein L,D-transpeptidase YafK
VSPAQRHAGARERRLAVAQQLFADAAVAFPPTELLLRGFKQERLLEVWAADTRTSSLTHVTTYEICYASGTLGPKRREGDLQVPEGFYTVNYFNSASRFHLSMQVSYPNLSDRKRGDPVSPGGEIMIHGHCVSAGCLAMTDERIEELWVMATALRDSGGRVHVQLFPSRDIPKLVASGAHPEHHGFWRNLNEGLERFAERHEPLSVQIEPDGRYRFMARP